MKQRLESRDSLFTILQNGEHLKITMTTKNNQMGVNKASTPRAKNKNTTNNRNTQQQSLQ